MPFIIVKAREVIIDDNVTSFIKDHYRQATTIVDVYITDNTGCEDKYYLELNDDLTATFIDKQGNWWFGNISRKYVKEIKDKLLLKRKPRASLRFDYQLRINKGSYAYNRAVHDR
ncbi:hypothetical protein [Proteus mirabilis]|uniref:hypothetical protein n=1 Tax=Proteus mirabilis TaxID=584 RepID=UPI0034D75677